MQLNQTFNNNLLSEFYLNHNAWLCAWLRKKIGFSSGNTLDAADISQDTFLRLLLKKDLETIIEPRAYLTHIAHGLLVSKIRRQDLEKSYLDALMHFSPTDVPSPELRLIVLETLVSLDNMLDGLPPKVRSAFLLLQLEGNSYSEIAKKLAVSTRTVGNYIAKAMLHCMLIKDE